MPALPRFDFASSACIGGRHEACPYPERCPCTCHKDVASTRPAAFGEVGASAGSTERPGVKARLFAKVLSSFGTCARPIHPKERRPLRVSGTGAAFGRLTPGTEAA